MPSTYWMTSAPILAFPCQAHHEHACTLRLQLPRFCCTGRRGHCFGEKALVVSTYSMETPPSCKCLIGSVVSFGPTPTKRGSQVLVTPSSSSFNSLLNHHFVSDAPPALLDQVNFQPSNALPRIFIALTGADNRDLFPGILSVCVPCWNMHRGRYHVWFYLICPTSFS